MICEFGFARFHRTAGYKNHRDVQAHRGHQHSGGDFVAVGDAHQGVGTVGIDHVLDGVGDDVSRGQTVEHAVMAHGDAVVDRNGVELFGHTTGFFDFPCDQLAHVLEMNMAGHKLGKGVGDGDNGFMKVFVFHPGGTPQGASTSHIPASGGGLGAINGHGSTLRLT